MSVSPITPRQLEYLLRLLDQKEVQPKPGNTIESMKAQAPGLSRAAASAWISKLADLPRKAAAPAGVVVAEREVPNVLPGRYALEYADDELNPIRFFKVSAGKNLQPRGGKDWSGFIFVDRYAGDDTFPVKGADRLKVLERIAENPLAAGQLYGREQQRCSVCGRNLTRALSRYLAIGPVCGARLFEGFGEMIAAGREALLAQGIDPDGELDDEGGARIKFRVSEPMLSEQFDRATRDFELADRRLREGDYADENEKDELDALRGAAGKLAAELRVGMGDAR